ncbi:hypothetical protein GGR53DRAFT_245547 [Hypoxylon sp. FL1150]|nr:hypothetical protein GGR53DRAFT_245547 [Hypoxylon sp. FL1150]
MMGPPSHYHGSLVAFEGPLDTISTQLRLLPNSPNILIVPPLQHFLREQPDGPFDARSHILMVHRAFSERIEIAQAFLRDSTPNNKRLVFMNGGTASAQVACVGEISKYLTDGDFSQAERIFRALVRNGVAGLYNWHTTGVGSASSQTVAVSQQPTEQDEETPSDPASTAMSAAMRAAEALDLETAFLQPNNELDLTTIGRRRSTSVPVYRLADDFQNAAPFYVFGACQGQKREPSYLDTPRTPRRSYTTRESRKDDQQTLDVPVFRTPKYNEPSSPSVSGEDNSRSQLSLVSADCSSVRSFGFESPTTPAVHRAYAVDVRPSASTTSHKHTRSVDRIYASAIRNQDILLCSFPQPPRDRPQSQNVVHHRGKPFVRSKFFSEIPRPTFSTPNRPSARRGPPTPLKLDRPIQRPASYVDRGTNPDNNYVDSSTSMEPELESEPTLAVRAASYGGSISLRFEPSFELDPCEPFETVLPMPENLVLLFKGEKVDVQLEATIQAFRNGTYPINMQPVGPEIEENFDRIDTPSPRTRIKVPAHAKGTANGVQHEEVTPTSQLDSDEYDPFAPGKYTSPPACEHKTDIRRPSTPPTPAQTPPFTATKPKKCFHDFTTTDCRTAVCMQNSLRSILNIYFPPEDAGYHQFNFPLLPELSSLWKPVFREADSGTVIQRKSKVDLILAIGAQKGVDKEFLGAISGSLEKLGAKPNGVTRSGRLDLRFLIASAMQAFTSQPLANQTQDNPFTNPLLLATLIIPHLETYLAAHSATRFLLLEYPPEHLSTVLSLQRLVGVDLLRVAGILDAEIGEPKAIPIPPPKHEHTRTNSSKTGILSVNGTKSGATLLSPTNTNKGDTPPPFSKANYILTSSANESEIARLISTIWKILIGVSTFYIPEGAAIRASVAVDSSTTSFSSASSLYRPQTAKQQPGSKTAESSHGRPLAQSPLINPAQQDAPLNAPLAGAARMMEFETAPREHPRSHVEPGTTTTTPPPVPSRHHRRRESRDQQSQQQQQQEASSPMMKSRRGSISETIRSSKTVRTMRSQRNKLKHMLGKEAVNADTMPDAAPAHRRVLVGEEVEDDEDDDGFSAEERKYMPLFGREDGPRKGNSRKALKWLGLAT